MKPLFVSILLFVPFLLGARYYFVCQTLQWCERDNLALVEVPTFKLTLPDGDERTLGLTDYSSGAVLMSRTSITLAAYDSLAAFLKRFEDETLLVNAPYRRGESSASLDHYRDLGLARAAALSQELQRRGVAGERVELMSYPVAPGQALSLELSFQQAGPEFSMADYPTGKTLLDSTALLGLRFETNSTALSPNAAFTDYANELVTALNADTTLRITLIGHTDSRAAQSFNDSLGLWRAEAVARYLQQLGYQAPIATTSRGERSPIASNDSADGRYLNRRVEVRID